MDNKLNHYYYYYHHNNHYNGSCSSRLQIKDHHDEQQPKLRMRQVQVVYYLSRNGQLEHPHFMELTLSSPYLRLKDVLERLTALRGKDMPALYSWSCKRSYKHGYVWNDLTQNDVIYPTQGPDEYVLKGSQLPEKLAALQIINSDQNKTRAEQEIVVEEDDNSNSSYSFSTANTPPSRCSVGISTDDILQEHSPSPPSLSTSPSSSSDKCIVEPSRNSVLLQLVACGGSNRCGMRQKQIVNKEDRKVVTVVVCKIPPSNNQVDTVDEDEAMIKCMSENPRFGGFQTENKEYFSGSIVEAAAAEERVAGEPSVLKRSNSFNEERVKAGTRRKVELRRREHVKVERQMAIAGKCMPRRKKKQADHKC